jgi:two-component system CheB/CheR fusion protein
MCGEKMQTEMNLAGCKLMSKQTDPAPNGDFNRLIINSFKSYAIFSTDQEGIVRTWSPGAEAVMRFTATEIIGRSADILFVPEDIAAGAPAKELATALREGRAVNERFHVKKDRSRFWGSGLVFPLLDNDGAHIGFSKIMRNISEAEEAEKNLREERALAHTMVNTYREPIVILNTALEVVDATSAFTEFFSQDKPSLMGSNFYEIIDGGLNIKQLSAKLQSALMNQEFHRDMEVEYEHANQGTRSLLVKLRHIYQPPSQLFKLEFLDLTENRALMEEKDIFITVASHEVRTPLSVIKAYGQILDRELKAAKPIVRQAIEKINQQISYINTLINALLDTSKITTGKLALNTEAFNLCDLATEIVDGFRLTQQTHEIIVEQQADFIVHADRVRTGSVITNLLSNAVKYSPGAKQVIVRMTAVGNTVKLSVEDFGLGIPVSEQDKLFKRFGRTDSIKKTRIPGTGLGLHLAAEITRLQGGTMGFSSGEGKGSVFYFTLPVF